MTGFVDYKEMYLKLFRETEKAINILIQAQQECEEMYISVDDGKDKIVDISSRFDEQ